MSYMTEGNHPEFDHDFRRGKVGEDLVDTFLGDLEDGTIEVKTDYKTHETGNFYIEFEQWNPSGVRKPSGIMTSKATYWVLASPDSTGGIMVKTAWLRKMLEDCIFDTREQPIVNGNTNASRGYIVPAKTLYKKLKLGV